MRARIAVWAMLTILLVGAMLPAINIAHGSNSTTFSGTPPIIQDFLINNTATGNTTQFAFYVSDSVALQNCTFSEDNGTGNWANYSTQLSGTGPTNVTFTVNPFTVTTLLNFTFWVWNTNSSISPATIGYRTLAIYNSSMPYTSLGKAINAVEGANNWTTSNDALGISGVDPYQGLILNQNTTAQYVSAIDSYAAGDGKVLNATFNSSTVDTSGAGGGHFTWWSGSGYDVFPDNASYAIDNNTNTGAKVYFTYADFSYFVTFNFSSIVANVNNIEFFFAENNATDVYISELDVYNNSKVWSPIISSIPQQITTWNAYFNISVQQPISAVKLQIHALAAVTVSLDEIQGFTPEGLNYLDVLKYCAYSEKMNLTSSQFPNKQRDIRYALGNITMGGSLPLTDYTGGGDFGIWDAWALYGYYYAVTYGGDLTKWNITAAYNQYDTAVSYTVHLPIIGLPMYIYPDGTGATLKDRFYEEDTCTILNYLVFYYLLNVSSSSALAQAQYYWNYTITTHWNPLDTQSLNQTLQYFRYSNYWGATGAQDAYQFEMSGGEFLKITSIMKYYVPNMVNYSYVLTDLGLRYLANEWNSYQWLRNDGTVSYVAVHLYDPGHGNDELCLDYTLPAWQALLGAYLQMNSTYQNNMKDMLSGNTTSNVQPAWSLLMSSPASLWNSTSKLFRLRSDQGETSRATAMGEITLFQMGVVPGTSTVAFPLEHLYDAYSFDIDPVLMAFNLSQTARQVTVPVVQAGTITFQYGESPITYNFTSSGVYLINFTSSWNMISSVTYQSALPSNLIYFYLPARALSVNISPTSVTLNVGQSQLFTSTVSGGTSPYTYQWYLNGAPVSGATNATWTFTLGSAGIYMVYVEVNDSVGAQATSNTSVATVNIGTHDVAVTNVAYSETVVGQGFSANINVTVANQGSYIETFNATAYANATIVGSENVTLSADSSATVTFTWNTTGFAYGNYTISAYVWPVQGENNTANNNFTGGVVTVTIPGDINGDGTVDIYDAILLSGAFGSSPGSRNWNPNADIKGDGIVDIYDAIILSGGFRQPLQ